MLAILGKSLLGAVVGYVALALLCALLLSLLSTNTHDKGMEISMTSFFVAGPVGAVLGLIGGLVLSLAKAGP